MLVSLQFSGAERAPQENSTLKQTLFVLCDTSNNIAILSIFFFPIILR